jgi:hypothetical protein
VKRRAPAPHTNGLPPEIAAGPDHPAWQAPTEHERRRAWLVAGREWSQANGHGWNGWRSLLPADVAYNESARGRAQRWAARRERA